MEPTFLNPIDKYGNDELKEFFQNNGFIEVVEVLAKNNMNGQQLLALKDFEILKWKVTVTEKMKFISFLKDLRNISPKLSDKNNLIKTNNHGKRKMTLKNMDIKVKLEAIISQKSLECTKRTPSPISPSCDYIPMDKAPKTLLTNQKLHDDDGYLMLVSSTQKQVKKINYSGLSKKICSPSRKVYSKPENDNDNSMNERTPMYFPRESTDSNGYLTGPALPKVERDDRYVNTQQIQSFARTIPVIRKVKSVGDLLSQTDGNAYFDRAEEALYDEPSIHTYENGSLQNAKSSTRKWPIPNLQKLKDHVKEFSTNSLDRKRSTAETSDYVKKRPLPPPPPKRKYFKKPIVNRTPNIDKKFIKPVEEDNTWQGSGNVTKNSEAKKQLHLEIKISNARILPSPPTTFPEIPLDPIIEKIYNTEEIDFGDNPYFINTSRDGAEALLHDFEDGVFLFRPSKHFFLTLSLKQHKEYYHLGLEKTATNKLRIFSTNEEIAPEFSTLKEFISHFTKVPLTFHYDGTIVEVVLLEKVLTT